ncbi:MAG: alpha-amylase, partial [Methanoregulaceae archaeon]|nr:alpha-amylase [Methanoregulaceae archaeon]
MWYLCSPDGTCSLTGIQNILQQSAFWCLEDGQHLIIDRKSWRNLQATDHFTRMALRSGSCGRFVSSCTSQETWEYFSAYMRILGHLESAGTRLHRSRLAARALRCLPPEHAFHFFTEHHYTGYSAYSLTEFARLLEFVPDTVF